MATFSGLPIGSQGGPCLLGCPAPDLTERSTSHRGFTALGTDMATLIYSSQYYLSTISVLGRPTPLGLLSPMRGIAVSWYQFPGIAWLPWVARLAQVAREAHGRLPLFR